MILEEETKEAFGYYSRDLNPKSRKYIIVACELCGKFRITKKCNYRTFCGSCEHNGKTFSGKHKYNLSEALKGNIRSLGYIQTKEHKRKRSEAQKGVKFTEEHKRKLSISRINRMHNSPPG